MNEPNATSEQVEPSAQPSRMSSRATNFLLMAHQGGQSQTAPLEQTNANAYENPPELSQQQAEQPSDPAAQASVSSDKQKSAIKSSVIHPAQRPGNETTQAPKTDKLTKSPAPKISEFERERIKEEKIDRIADKITDVLKKISDIKTGMLSPEMGTGQKIQMMAGNSPGLNKFLTVLLTQLEPLLLLVHRINQKLVEKKLVAPSPVASSSEEIEESMPQAPPAEKVSFLELAEKNIIFCDNRKKPLYSLEQMRGKHGYTASEEVLAPMILENIILAFHEVAPKAKAIPTPTSGMYANIPMDQVMENIAEEEIMHFLAYVQRFPRGYVGKNFRITESFAGWVVSGTPDD